MHNRSSCGVRALQEAVEAYYIATAVDSAQAQTLPLLLWRHLVYRPRRRSSGGRRGPRKHPSPSLRLSTCTIRHKRRAVALFVLHELRNTHCSVPQRKNQGAPSENNRVQYVMIHRAGPRPNLPAVTHATPIAMISALRRWPASNPRGCSIFRAAGNIVGAQNTNISARTSLSQPFGTTGGRGAGGGAAFELLDEDIEERFVKASLLKPDYDPL